MNIEAIAATLRTHNGTWDSWGWTCRGCDAGQQFAEVDAPLTRNFANESHAALLTHQAEAIINV